MTQAKKHLVIYGSTYTISMLSIQLTSATLYDRMNLICSHCLKRERIVQVYAKFSFTQYSRQYWPINVELAVPVHFIFTYTIYRQIYNCLKCNNKAAHTSQKKNWKHACFLWNSILFETKHMHFHTNFTHCFAFKWAFCIHYGFFPWNLSFFGSSCSLRLSTAFWWALEFGLLIFASFSWSAFSLKSFGRIRF